MQRWTQSKYVRLKLAFSLPASSFSSVACDILSERHLHQFASSLLLRGRTVEHAIHVNLLYGTLGHCLDSRIVPRSHILQGLCHIIQYEPEIGMMALFFWTPNLTQLRKYSKIRSRN